MQKQVRVILPHIQQIWFKIYNHPVVINQQQMVNIKYKLIFYKKMLRLIILFICLQIVLVVINIGLRIVKTLLKLWHLRFIVDLIQVKLVKQKTFIFPYLIFNMLIKTMQLQLNLFCHSSLILIIAKMEIQIMKYQHQTQVIKIQELILFKIQKTLL